MSILQFPLRFNIESWCKYLPGEAIDNLTILEAQEKDLGKKRLLPSMVDLAIRKRFGQDKRHWVRKPWEPVEANIQNSEDLAYEACKGLQLKKTPSFLIHGTTTSSRYTSSQAAAIAGRLAWQVPACEVKAGCSTSLLTLMTGLTYLHAGYEDIVLSCAETLSKVLSPEEPESWFGLSDAGAALHLVKDPLGAFEVKKLFFKTYGEHVDLFTTRGLLPPTASEVQKQSYMMSGDADKMKSLSYQYYKAMLENFLVSQKERESITWIIPHQVNKQIIRNLKKDLGLSGEIVWIADRFGNPGGTSLLLALASAMDDGLFKNSGRILLMSVGGGLSCACQVIDFHKESH